MHESKNYVEKSIRVEELLRSQYTSRNYVEDTASEGIMKKNQRITYKNQ